jgi:Pyruvate/2-oxoacid:ferredoxin oxidoreductase gamma subunit
MPMDICGTVSVNGASFVARTTSFDKALPKLIAQAIENEGFSLIDIWELCTAYYVPENKYSKKKLEEAMETYGFARGVLRREPRPEYTRAYREAVSDQVGKPVATLPGIEPEYDHSLTSPLCMVVAGAAGKRIGSAAAAFCRGAVLSGLWATQRNEYPVTVRAGYSISEVILSPQEIRYTGIQKPDLMLVLFPEGLDKAHRQIDSLTADDTLYLNGQLTTVTTPTQKVVLDFRKSGKRSEYWAIMALAELLRRSRIYPLEAFRQALAAQEKFAEENLAAMDANLIVQSETLPP